MSPVAIIRGGLGGPCPLQIFGLFSRRKQEVWKSQNQDLRADPTYKLREDGIQTRRLSWLQAPEGGSKLLWPERPEILFPSYVRTFHMSGSCLLTSLVDYVFAVWSKTFFWLGFTFYFGPYSNFCPTTLYLQKHSFLCQYLRCPSHLPARLVIHTPWLFYTCFFLCPENTQRPPLFVRFSNFCWARGEWTPTHNPASRPYA